MTAEEIIRLHGMERHPEGGWYREVHRSPALTAIHFLLPRGDFSAFHRLKKEEAWVHLAGAPLELFLLGRERGRLLLSPAGSGGEPVLVVPAGVAQAARSLGDYTLCACLVAPGFDFGDFSLPSREELIAAYPAEAERIRALTR